MTYFSKTQRHLSSRGTAPQIDNTKIMHRVAVVGREIIFTLDMERLPTPTLNPTNNHALFKYLRDVSKNAQLLLPVL